MNKLNNDINEATLLKLLSNTKNCLLIVGKKRINLIMRNNRKVLNTLIPPEFELFIKLIVCNFSITS